MSGHQEGERGPGNVVSLQDFKSRGNPPPRTPACIRIDEDEIGDVAYRIEGVTALNALGFLEMMVRLSGRVLKIYTG